MKYVLGILAVLMVIAGCTQHNPQIGNLTMAIPPGGADGSNGMYVQAFVVVAPDASLATKSDQTQDTQPDINLGLNGGAASNAGNAEGIMKVVSQVAEAARERVQARMDAEEGVIESKPVEEEVEAEEDKPAVTTDFQKYYHHTTTGSSDGGKSLVLCPGDTRVDLKCSVGDVKIPFHGYDTGRVSYWNMKEVPIGPIVCEDKEGNILKFRAEKTNDLGSCKAEDK